jgi:hypothetical protein
LRKDWEVAIRFLHSFTDKSVDALGIPNFNYDGATDARSWAVMRQMFEETF